jgi:hypothetical protein
MAHPETVATMHDDGIQVPSLRLEPGTTIIIGGCNVINPHNIIQFAGEGIENVTQMIQTLPPDMVKELIGPITQLIAAIGVALSRSE